MQEFDPQVHGTAEGHTGPDLDATQIGYESDGSLEPEGGLDIGIDDGQEVDLDGDGVVDGVAEVTYSDLDGDGSADQATVTVHADTDGDGQADAIVIVDQFDTDGDGLADKVDVTYGVDSDGDGMVDESQFASGTITSTPTDTDGDGQADSVSQDIEWDETIDGETPGADYDDTEIYSDDQPPGDAGNTGDAGDGGDGDFQGAAVHASHGSYLVDADLDDDDQATAYVDPATGQWVEGTPTF